MKIRKATLKDFEKLKKLMKKFFLSESKTDKNLDPTFANKKLGLLLAKNLRKRNMVYFVAEEEDLVGYIALLISKNQPFLKEKKKGSIYELFVEPSYQRKGVGKKLMQIAQKWFKKKRIKDQTVTVYSWNKIANNLYKSFGFNNYNNILKK